MVITNLGDIGWLAGNTTSDYQLPRFSRKTRLLPCQFGTRVVCMYSKESRGNSAGFCPLSVLCPKRLLVDVRQRRVSCSALFDLLVITSHHAWLFFREHIVHTHPWHGWSVHRIMSQAQQINSRVVQPCTPSGDGVVSPRTS